MISYGGNDLIWLQNQAPPCLAPLPYIQSLATALTSSIASLQAAGARDIVVLNVYAYAKLVGPGGSMTGANATVVSEAATYSAEVWSGLGAAGVNFVPADVEGVLRYVSQNPTHVRLHDGHRPGVQPGMRRHRRTGVRPERSRLAQCRADLSVG